MLARWLTRPYPVRRDRPLVLAHRGASADAPENTRAAFREAARQGADGIELDVMRCASGELVVCHDPWLDRLAGEHLEVARTPWPVLRRLDVGRRFGGAFAGERLATLDEVLAELPRIFFVNVEIKCDELVNDRGLAWKLARAVHHREVTQEIVFSSFNPLALARARLFAPRVPTALLIGASHNLPVREQAAKALGVSGLHVEAGLCARENVRRWREQGLRVAAWTVDEPAAIERCCHAGVDVVITNQPAATRSAIERMGIADERPV